MGSVPIEKESILEKLEYKMKVTLAVLLVAALLVCSVLGGARRKRQYVSLRKCWSEQDCPSSQPYCDIFNPANECKHGGYKGNCVADPPACGSLKEPIQRSAPVPVQPSGGYDNYDYGGYDYYGK